MNPSHTDLVEQFEDVALQRYLMLPRVGDRALAADGWVLRYAIDTNVLSSYVSAEDRPEANATTFIGAGEVFRSDDIERKQAIAASLNYHIFHGLQPEAPLLFIPPLHVEFKKTIEHFLVERVETSTTVKQEEFQSLLEEIETRAEDLTDDDLRSIRHAVLQDNGRHARVRRLRQIFDRDRLRNAHTALDPEQFDQDFREALRPESGEISRSYEVSVFKAAWVARLIASGRKSGAEARRDAEALARIELYNRRLEVQRKRLIYITGDTSLLEAGLSYTLSTSSGTKTNFASCFLRHPRAFLDEPGVLNPQESLRVQGTSLTHWMDLLLGQFDDADKIIAPVKGRITLPNDMVSALAEVADNGADRYEQFDIISKWRSYETVSTSDAPDPAILLLLKGLKKRESDPELAARRIALIKSSVVRLRDQIQDEKDEAWENFFVVSMASRFVIEISERASAPVREVAPACFEGRPKLLNFINVAEQWLTSEATFSRDEYFRQITGIRSEDPSGYSDYLGHANLLAHQGHWRSAAILCVRAKEVVRADPSDPIGSNGREANYLEAFYRRNSARTRADLDGLDELIASARNIYHQELELVSKSGDSEWPHNPVPERFTSEELALVMTRHFFDWARAPVNKKPEYLTELGRLVPLLRQHEQLLVKQLGEPEQSEPSGVRPARVTDPHFRQQIRKKLLMRTRRNILAIGLLNSSFRVEAMEAWKGLPNPSEINVAIQSRYGTFLWQCGAALFGKMKREREQAWRDVILARDGEDFSDLKVFPYDDARLRALVDSVQQ